MPDTDTLFRLKPPATHPIPNLVWRMEWPWSLADPDPWILPSPQPPALLPLSISNSCLLPLCLTASRRAYGGLGCFQQALSALGVHQRFPGRTASWMQWATQKAIQVLASSISTSWIYQGLGVVGSKARIFSQLSHLQVAPLLYKRPQSSQTSPHL